MSSWWVVWLVIRVVIPDPIRDPIRDIIKSADQLNLKVLQLFPWVNI
jgi:hypothetical protein